MQRSMQPVAAELGYADLFRMVRNSRVAIVAMVAAGGIGAATFAFLMKPVYRAEVLLAPAATESGGGSTISRLAQQFAPLTGLVGGFDASEGLATKEVRIATLRSRRLTEQFIMQRDLLPELFPGRWDAAAKRWKGKDGKPGVPSMGDAVKRFDEQIRAVNEDRRTGLVTLSIEWSDPSRVADWANDLVARTNEFLRERSIEESERSIAFLEKELDKTAIVERQQIIYRLIESKMSEIMMANARTEYAFVVVDPAVAPDPGRFVRPRRIVIIGVGLLLGLFAGLAYAAFRTMLRRGRPAAES